MINSNAVELWLQPTGRSLGRSLHSGRGYAPAIAAATLQIVKQSCGARSTVLE
jgi:hypothetical protein